jgi:large subunit ribosomal protein L32
MANPKRRHSKARSAKRRSHHALSARQTVQCDNCGAAALPHRVCGACGYYKGRQVMTVKLRTD